jgi:hypothetical protein
MAGRTKAKGGGGKAIGIAASAAGTGYLAVDMFLKGRFAMAAFNAAACVCLAGYAVWTLSRK